MRKKDRTETNLSAVKTTKTYILKALVKLNKFNNRFSEDEKRKLVSSLSVTVQVLQIIEEALEESTGR